tara:strand:+ start:288 stop:941 length:654 start_codon:yes stop_codon:yes gene_type:complete
MENNITVLRPFGPSIAKVTIPIEIVEKLNKYVDETVADENKSKELDYGAHLAGNVKQEFRLEQKFMNDSGWGNFLANSAAAWIHQSLGRTKKITKFTMLSSWIVRQFDNEYNPLHVHGGHISGVGYLKVPKTFGKLKQDTKSYNNNGNLNLVHGTRMFLSQAIYNIEPKVGDFYFFPNYLLHTVYPFNGTNEERRSISFNALIDNEIYDVYNAHVKG